MRDCQGATAVRWAARVNPSLIRRLYEADAHGIADDELTNRVGFALFARCQSILQVGDAHVRGRVKCPCCGLINDVGVNGTNRLIRNVVVMCGECGWSVRWGDYVRTYQHKHLAGGGAVAFHELVKA